MGKLSKIQRFGTCRLCAIVIVSTFFTASAFGQEPADQEKKDDIDARSLLSDGDKAVFKALHEQRKMAEEQRIEATAQLRKALVELEKLRRAPAEAAAERDRMQAQLEMARAQLADLAARQKQADRIQSEALPEDTILRIYQLQHVKPQNLAAVLAPIFRNNAPRIAVEERANALVVAGNEQQLSIIEELARTLDRPAPEAESQNAGETLQVRIVWLLDINDGMEPTDKLVSPQVIEALGELGFEHPRVVCQQVTTLTLGEDENRRGRFNFMVPVLIQSHPWQLEGQGEIVPIAGQRFNLKFDLRFHQVVSQGGGGRGGQIQQGQLGGSIYTPLGHYTVMGTTTFVAQAPAPLPDDSQPGDVGTGGVVQNQHLSAFVVYLDRAREFPAEKAQPEDRNDARRR
ncbi:MAG TPA: secretin N-terminal domain-containing protein [Lacipirellulaceae bacterium]